MNKPKKQREKLFWSRRAKKIIEAADAVWVKELEAKRKAALKALKDSKLYPLDSSPRLWYIIVLRVNSFPSNERRKE